MSDARTRSMVRDAQHHVRRAREEMDEAAQMLAAAVPDEQTFPPVDPPPGQAARDAADPHAALIGGLCVTCWAADRLSHRDGLFNSYEHKREADAHCAECRGEHRSPAMFNWLRLYLGRLIEDTRASVLRGGDDGR